MGGGLLYDGLKQEWKQANRRLLRERFRKRIERARRSSVSAKWAHVRQAAAVRADVLETIWVELKDVGVI